MDLQPEFWYHIAGIFLLSGICFLLIPGLGAFNIRGSWRRFRALLLKAASYPGLTYQAMRALSEEEGEEGRNYHFFGSLQALQGDTGIWLTDGSVTVRADLRKIFVYQLSSGSLPMADSLDQYPTESPRRVRWEQISSLPEYTGLFISGRLHFRDGQYIFLDSPEDPLLVIIYEGENRNLLVRATWSGRQKNEYWNAYTPGAVFLGSFALFGYSYFLLRNAQFVFLGSLAVSLALLPISVFFPPGLLCYYFYRRFWKHGRVLRARRDLIRLSEVDSSGSRFPAAEEGYPAECGDGKALPAEVAKNCERRAFLYEGLSVLIFGSGLLIMGLLIFTVFSYLAL